MELLNIITERRSIRKFKPNVVPDDMIKKLLDAARLAPSAGNCQPWRFVVVKNLSCKELMTRAIPQPFVTQAPLVIVVCIDKIAMSDEYLKQRREELFAARSFFVSPTGTFDSDDCLDKRITEPKFDLSYLSINVAIAIDHLTLRAVDLGLGTCWVMKFDNDKIKEALQLDDRYEPFVILPIGFPSQKPKLRPRMALKDILIKEIT